MKMLKKFWMFLIAAFPFGSWALTPLAIGAIAVGVGIVGVSIWRSVSPVNMQQALEFFSSCWTCQVFSDVMISMSNLLPGVYHSLGRVVIPMAATLLAVLVAWRLSSNMINGKTEDASKLLGNFSTYVVKLSFLIILLLMPLPRFITSIFIEPAMTVGTSFDYVVSGNDSFSECMVLTAIADPVSVSNGASQYGAFSPKLRHQLACEIANVHQITGLGMTVGWTILNAAFDVKYQHKILEALPIFPNVPLILAGLLLLVVYFYALLPIPLYFLEIFVKLSMDLIMLPLMLLAWVFDENEFKIFPQGGQTIRKMIDDVIKAVVGIALTVVFLAFSIMFLDVAFGGWSGANELQHAIEANDSDFLVQGLLLQNDSIITAILMGVFIAMFMTMIPQLTNMLFEIKISDKYYETAEKDVKLMWEKLKKWGNAIKK
ncbi:MAG: hypothetical protein J6S57_00180 [Alphaproteobacteria bacterium]|nr:hypothetical protein [Alphaproteobacteria bacterium]